MQMMNYFMERMGLEHIKTDCTEFPKFHLSVVLYQKYSVSKAFNGILMYLGQFFKLHML